MSKNDYHINLKQKKIVDTCLRILSTTLTLKNINYFYYLIFLYLQKYKRL